MLAILSPAKSLDTTQPTSKPIRTQPVFESDTAILLGVMKKKSPNKLKAMMGISDKLASLNHQRFQTMTVPGAEDGIPASMLFAGDVYRGLDARSLDERGLEWAQENVAILSGFYGLLRPLDRADPYRLEMGTKLKTRRGGSLYEFWGTRLAKRADHLLESHEDKVIVNLASGEYAKAISRKALKADWVDVQFKEVRDGKPRIISFFAKFARGRMARWIVDERVSDRNQLRGFSEEGYRFDSALSSSSSLVFTRSSSA